ncbi:MAG: MaoC family dehydratase [Promethearchaeota archaeon]
MVTIIKYDEAESKIGTESDWTPWMEIKQEKINEFAEATGDHQWIHVDVERAIRESPFGGPIAHGWYSVSLLPVLQGQTIAIVPPEGKQVKLGVNYGANKIRFPSPVPVGKRIHAKGTLAAVKSIDKPMPGMQYQVNVEIWVEGANKPSMVAEVLSRLYVG